jgi:phosphatidylethanolamine/phosphatidyl-N-methylethanolamine N-methyltransferase
VRLALVEDALARVGPGGGLIQFSYGLKPPVAALPGRFTVRRTAFVLANLPPARVWLYQRDGVAG